MLDGCRFIFVFAYLVRVYFDIVSRACFFGAVILVFFLSLDTMYIPFDLCVSCSEIYEYVYRYFSPFFRCCFCHSLCAPWFLFCLVLTFPLVAYNLIKWLLFAHESLYLLVNVVEWLPTFFINFVFVLLPSFDWIVCAPFTSSTKRFADLHGYIYIYMNGT